MPPFTEPLGVYFSPMTPGYAVATWGLRAVKGIFRAPFSSAGVGTMGIEAASPSFDCRAADVTGIAHGEVLRIDGSDFTVRGVQPNGAGIVQLMLEDTDG